EPYDDGLARVRAERPRRGERGIDRTLIVRDPEDNVRSCLPAQSERDEECANRPGKLRSPSHDSSLYANPASAPTLPPLRQRVRCDLRPPWPTRRSLRLSLRCAGPCQPHSMKLGFDQEP